MKKIFFQAIKFFGISGIGWLIDMVIFTTLTNLEVNTILSNIISSLVAVTFVYFTSTKKIFINKNEKINLNKKYVVYIIYQVLMILASSTLIGLINNGIILYINYKIFLKYSKIIAKILVTPLTMICNFIFMKLLIEKI